MKGEKRLYGLSPKRGFITVKALKYTTVKVGKSQKGIRQPTSCIMRMRIVADIFYIMGLIPLNAFTGTIMLQKISCRIERVMTRAENGALRWPILVTKKADAPLLQYLCLNLKQVSLDGGGTTKAP